MNRKERAAIAEKIDIQETYYNPIFDIQINRLEKQVLNEQKSRKSTYCPSTKKKTVPNEIIKAKEKLREAKRAIEKFWKKGRLDLVSKWEQRQLEAQKVIDDYEKNGKTPA